MSVSMSIWIAKLVGPAILVSAFSMLASPKSLQALASDFLGSRALIFITGIMMLVSGLAIVNAHNLWIADWPVVITVFGWAMVIGGAARAMFPALVVRIGNTFMDHVFTSRSGGIFITRAAGAVWALIGGFLTYKGYA